MKSLKLCLVVFSFVLISNSTCLLAGEKDIWSDVEKLSKSKPVKKNSIDGNGEQLIAKSFAVKRDVSVKQLIAILRNKKLSTTARIAAAKMLGTLRAPEAVDPLMEQLSKLQPMMIDEKTLETISPCYAALCQIGKPASRKALILLQQENDSYRKSLLHSIISKVEGREVATFLVKAEIKKTKDKEVRARLEAALKKL